MTFATFASTQAARIPAGRSRFDQQRRRREEHDPKTGEQPGGPRLENPRWAARPPPRSRRDHREKAAGPAAGWARRHGLAAPPASGSIADTTTTGTPARPSSFLNSR